MRVLKPKQLSNTDVNHITSIEAKCYPGFMCQLNDIDSVDDIYDYLEMLLAVEKYDDFFKIYNLLDDLKTKESIYLLVAHNGISRVIHSYFNDMTNEEYAVFGIKNCEVKKYSWN